jgi:cytochrome c oxidase cbb3-type subunit I
MWAGPHHLHYTALPDWAQSLGMVFSLMLLAPSWGGMINGIMTLSGAWHKLRTDPILKFLIVSLSFYGMSTFEGADDVDQDRQRAVALHRLDHRPRPCRRAGLGGMITFGASTYLIPRSTAARRCTASRLIDLHFWIATIGIVLYIASMWIAGVMQGLMWRAVNPRRHADLHLHRVAWSRPIPTTRCGCSAACSSSPAC